MCLKILIVIFAITFCRFYFSSLRFHITAEVCNCKIRTKEQRNHDTAVKRVSWGYAQPRILAIHFSAAFLARRWIQPMSFFSEFHDPIVDQYLQTFWLLKSDKRVIKIEFNIDLLSWYQQDSEQLNWVWKCSFIKCESRFTSSKASTNMLPFIDDETSPSLEELSSQIMR